MISLGGICPDDRADWPVIPDCGDLNASTTTCATPSSLFNALTNITVSGTLVETWNTTLAWVARASEEVSILNNLLTQEMKAHGSLNTTNETTSVDVEVASGRKHAISSADTRSKSNASATQSPIQLGKNAAKKTSGKTSIHSNMDNFTNSKDANGGGSHATSYAMSSSLLPSMSGVINAGTAEISIPALSPLPRIFSLYRKVLPSTPLQQVIPQQGRRHKLPGLCPAIQQSLALL